MYKSVRRGDIFIANLEPVIGSEQGGVRPVLVIQNDIGNKYSPTTIVAAISTKIFSKNPLPTHYLITPDCGISNDSIVLLEQIKTIDKIRLKRKIGHISQKEMLMINRLIELSLGLNFVNSY